MLSMMHHPFAPAFDSFVVDALLFGGGVPTPPQRYLHEDETSYKVVVAAPGVAARDVQVAIDDGALKVDGKTGSHAIRSVVVALPRDADADQVTAECVDGLLTVTIAKRAPAEPTAIKVHTTPTADERQADEPHYTISLAIPGLAASDLTILVDEDGVLTVRGETERSGARVDRSYRLPSDAQGALAHATHVDGMTRVVVPKRAPEKTLIPVVCGATEARVE